MRKADYAALAAILREHVEKAREAIRRAPPDSALSVHHSAQFLYARDIAHDCARQLTVDRAQFLTACGLAPD